MERIGIMEVDPLEECRTLLTRRNEATLSQRLRQNCLRIPSERAIAFGIMLCLLLSILFLLGMQIYSSNSTNIEPIQIYREEEDVYYLNGTGDTKKFMEEWKKSKDILNAERKQLFNLYNEVLIHRGTTLRRDVDINFSLNDKEPVKLVDCALILEQAKKTLKKCISIDALPEECLKLVRNTLQCDPQYPYRTINGSCNNLVNPTWGIGGAPYLRLLKPHYTDDVSSLRISVYGVELPNARLVSSRIYDKKILPDAETTMMFMNHGLFLDHDFIKSLLPFKEILIDCCEPEVQADPRLRHPSCSEIYVPSTDPFFIQRNITCLNFYRSIPAIGKCPGRREQSNVMTSYLDLSDTYGPTDEESKKLRSFEGGKLRHSLIGDTPVLPFNNGTGTLCYTRDVKYKCFSSGDVRVNMHTQIMVMHTIWMREHNRLAEALKRINPCWSDEKIFQEARRINIAEYQHITYNEFLPNIFGKKRMKEFGLEINPNEDYDDYDETIQSGVYNAFSSAAFRFGHTLVQSVWEFRGPDLKVRSRIPLRELYTNPEVIYNHGMDDIIRGMAMQPTYQTDRYTTREVRNRLLQRYYSDYGVDLTTITIHRGRDRGLPPYTKWRKFCGLEEIRSWDDMYKHMEKVRVDELREMYMSVDDVDLAPGGLSEHHLEGAMVGPTYACILRSQFRNARVSDRFWFENRNQAGSFTPNQLSEIYKSSFARIVCDNSDALQSIQKYPLRIVSNENPIISCDELPKVDLSFWNEDLRM